MSIINKEENVAMVTKESHIPTFCISTAAVQVLLNNFILLYWCIQKPESQ